MIDRITVQYVVNDANGNPVERFEQYARTGSYPNGAPIFNRVDRGVLVNPEARMHLLTVFHDILGQVARGELGDAGSVFKATFAEEWAKGRDEVSNRFGVKHDLR